jgi:hypothetical protein
MVGPRGVARVEAEARPGVALHARRALRGVLVEEAGHHIARRSKVFALPSSALKNTDRNGSRLSIPGRPLPTDPQAAIAEATQLLPCPGSPARSVNFPTGRYGLQRTLTACGCTSDIRVDLKAGRSAAAVLRSHDGAAAARERSSRATTASALPSRRRSSIQSEASPFAAKTLELEDAYLAGNTSQRLRDALGMRAATGVPIGNDSDVCAAQRLSVAGAPVACTSRIRRRRQGEVLPKHHPSRRRRRRSSLLLSTAARISGSRYRIRSTSRRLQIQRPCPSGRRQAQAFGRLRTTSYRAAPAASRYE